MSLLFKRAITYVGARCRQLVRSTCFDYLNACGSGAFGNVCIGKSGTELTGRSGLRMSSNSVPSALGVWRAQPQNPKPIVHRPMRT